MKEVEDTKSLSDSCRDPEMLELVETAADDLHQEAEAWARQHGCQQVRLRSNKVRVEAHRFYERIGYEAAKSQKVYWKAL